MIFTAGYAAQTIDIIRFGSGNVSDWKSKVKYSLVHCCLLENGHWVEGKGVVAMDVFEIFGAIYNLFVSSWFAIALNAFNLAFTCNKILLNFG
jgi:hypothetical protein